MITLYILLLFKNLTHNSDRNKLFLLLTASFLVRSLVAANIDLSNDEVNYWAYALYPSLSHFDHPPMVGYIIQLFTLNLTFQSEFFIRAASLVIGTINTYIIFLIGKRLFDINTGLTAAILYTGSVYCSVILGLFILPDTPLSLFWLLTFYFALVIVPQKNPDNRKRKLFLLLGVFIGLGMISKYTAAFLWIGIIAYILFVNRSWLKTREFYLSIMLSVLLFLPVIIWNFQNDFISFTFQSERVSLSESKLRFDFLGTELAGQIFYNNPINFGVIILSLIALFKKKLLLQKDYAVLLLLWSLPIIFVFLFSSLTRRTLPHWSAPGYYGLIIIAAVFLSSISKNKVHISAKLSVLLITIVILLGFIQIKTGVLYNDLKDRSSINLGENDASLDLFGWHQLSEEFSKIYKKDLTNNRITPNPYIITWRWFPAANYDYYIGNSAGVFSYAIGGLENIRNYFWINRKRIPPVIGSDAYFICSSRDYNLPSKFYSEYFTEFETADTIRIIRNNLNVMNYFVFRMKGLSKKP